MGIEDKHSSGRNNPPSIQELRRLYEGRLDSILNSKLTVENIDSFADDALNRLLPLVEEILDQYRNNPAFEADISLPTKEQEDDAFKKLGLLDIQQVIDRVIEVKEKIDDFKKQVEKYKSKTDEVLIPSGEQPVKTNETGDFERPDLRPRLITLLYILDEDFGITSDRVTMVEGEVTPDMWRRQPYVSVEVSDLNRIVYVCDEVGNATYVFDLEKLDEAGILVQDLDVSDKDSLNKLIKENPGIGIRVIQTKDWRTRISEILDKEIPEMVETSENADTEGSETLRRSEFEVVRKKEFLPYVKFQQEVRALYPGEGSVHKWYKTEQKNHSDWPAAPNIKYDGNGWEGWPELVGKENFLKKEFLPFLKFQQEVRASYPGEGNVSVWYRQEKKKHMNWPANPHDKYKDSGWVGWPELVGKENFLKKEYLPFQEFQEQLRAAYSGDVNIREWYAREQKKHPDWPSRPQIQYLDDGWEGFHNILGRDNFLEREFLPYEQFKEDVRAHYDGESGVYEWYAREQKKHPDWPSSPKERYSEDGWEGLLVIVGKETIEYLSYPDFVSEVRALFPGNRGIRTWYREEKKKHSDWPTRPEVEYGDSGWKGWHELFGVEKPKPFLTFEEFREEIREAYPGRGSIQKWYREERKKHPRWPSQPFVIYKEDGWVSLTEALGREKRYLPFTRFMLEVRARYSGESNIVNWYKKEQEGHEDWPTNPDYIYKGKGWEGWSKLVGNA